MIDAISLYNNKGTSDKVYHLVAQPSTTSPGLWDVLAWNGRRVGGLTARTKFSGVTERKARQEFRSIVDEKLRGGYVAGALAGPAKNAKEKGMPILPTPTTAPVATTPKPTWKNWDVEYAEAATALGISLGPSAFHPGVVILAELSMSMQDGVVDALHLASKGRDAVMMESKLLGPECLTWFQSLSADMQTTCLNWLAGMANMALEDL